VDLLGKALDSLHYREKVFVNGMLLGAFRGSEATGFLWRIYLVPLYLIFQHLDYLRYFV
jgi:hypothetical protein